MLLLIHILVALAGLASSASALIVPSKTRIRITFGFTILTVISGTALVISSHAPILQSCVTSLLFVGFTLAGAIAAQRRLAHQVGSK